MRKFSDCRDPDANSAKTPAITINMNRVWGIVLAMAALTAPAAAPAQSPSEPYKPSMAQTEAFDQCRLDHKGDVRACIGVTRAICLRQEANQTTAGAMICAERERTLWSNWGDGAVRALRKSLPEERRSFLEKEEQAWPAYREAICAYEASLYLGGSLAKVVAAECRLRETAMHAINMNDDLYRSTHDGESEGD